MFKVDNKNTRKTCEICSKLTIRTPERCYWHRFGLFIVNFEHISHSALVFLLLTLSKQMPAGQTYTCWNWLDKKFYLKWLHYLPRSCVFLLVSSLHSLEWLRNIFNICDALHDLVSFVQFKKREKHLWRSIDLNKVAGFSQQLY